MIPAPRPAVGPLPGDLYLDPAVPECERVTMARNGWTAQVTHVWTGTGWTRLVPGVVKDVPSAQPPAARTPEDAAAELTVAAWRARRRRREEEASRRAREGTEVAEVAGQGAQAGAVVAVVAAGQALQALQVVEVRHVVEVAQVVADITGAGEVAQHLDGTARGWDRASTG